MLFNLRRTDIFLVGLIALIGVLVLLPMLRWLVNEWFSNDYYSHGILVPLVSGFFAWRLLPTVERKTSHLGLFLLIAALIIYLVALFQRAYFVAAFGMIGLFAGLIWYLMGTAALKRMAFPLIFLIFMVPLPLVEGSSLPLSLMTGQIATVISQALGMEVSINGAAVTLPNANLVVGAQCSGLRSIVSLFTLVTVFAYAMSGPLLSKILLFLSTIPIAIIGNIFRVSSLLWVADRWGVEAGFTYYHDYSGIVFFVTAFACLILLARPLGCRNIRADLF